MLGDSFDSAFPNTSCGLLQGEGDAAVLGWPASDTFTISKT